MARPTAQKIQSSRWNSPWLAVVIFALIILCLFGDVLFQGEKVLGSAHGDLAIQFLPWRQFGFDQVRQGNFPLWNPHIFGGTQYFAGFQSALLYPPNWLHLVLPLAAAINWIIALHVFLAGFFTYLWCRYRGASQAGGMLAGVMFMLSGPYFLRIYAGHLPHLCVIVWIPLLLLSLDGLGRSGAWRWCLLGIAALAAQILAGHPQYVYYTVLLLAIYVAFNLYHAPHRRTLVIGFAIVGMGAAFLAAAQLLAGLEASAEWIRSGGLSIEKAGTFTLHPHALLTFLAPYALGNLSTFNYSLTAQPIKYFYFGPSYLWEICCFISITGLFLALYGMIFTRSTGKWTALVMLLLAVLLSVGPYTPLFKFLHRHLPMYADFRGTSKIFIFADLFLCLFAAWGFDALVKKGNSSRRFSAVAAVLATAGILMGAIAFAIVHTAGLASSIWAWFLQSIPFTGDSYANFLPDLYRNPEFMLRTAAFSSYYLYIAAAIVLFVALVIFLMRHIYWMGYILLPVIALELLCFAYATRDTIPAVLDYPADWAEAVEKKPGDYRVLHIPLLYQDWAMSRNLQEIWGYDPGVLKRYAQFIAFTQGAKPGEATQYMDFNPHPPYPHLFKMLRWKYIFIGNPRRPVLQLADPMPHLQLISQYQVLTSRDDIFNAMAKPDFDSRKKVILESQPSPQPVDAPDLGKASIIRQTTDELEIQADLPRSEILLITDNYSRGWRVIPLAPSGQSDYRVLPANYTLRAIPLTAGKHHILLKFEPRGYVLGKWISLIALAIYLILILVYVRRRNLSLSQA